MDAIKTVGIFSKPGVAQAGEILPGIVDWLAARGIAARIDHESAYYLGVAGLARERVPEGCQFVIVLGGDGTLLAAARAIGDRGIPLFGVNLGGLGFLTAITVDEIYPELERALQGGHRIGHRSMLDCTVVRGGEEVASYLALNDVAVIKTAVSGMIELATHVDNHYVCTYKADGLIVATPTGTTAYSLSAGGPIVFPTVPALAITPICPHMLTYRPVIVTDTSVIQVICNSDDHRAYLNIDGQVGQHLNRGDRVVCRRSRSTLELIRPPRLLYFDVLRQKLKWGE
jgi:NAD+ kinase